MSERENESKTCLHLYLEGAERWFAHSCLIQAGAGRPAGSVE